MKTFWLLLLTSSLGWSLFGQELPEAKYFADLAPRNIGPAGMSGRVTAIDVDLSDPDVIYAGTASGGLWKSTDGGIDWEPIFDDQPLQAIGAVAVDQTNPDVIWVGTGEGNPRNSHNTGRGLYRSLDGGASWQLMGLEDTRNIHRIIVHRDDPNTVYVGAMGSIWGPNPERGVYRTRDGGKTWDHVLSVDDGVGIADLVVDPSNPNKLLAAMWEFDRDPWFFNSGGPKSGLYITYDGGDNWKEITSDDGLPEGDLGRIGLAIAPSNPDLIYALVEAKVNGFYKSTDGGRNWSLVGTDDDMGNRPFYYSDIFVDPVNENRIYSLWSYVSLSEDGGKTFRVILDYGANVHPDHHAFWVHPNDPNYLIEGNDGGLNISRDRGKTWRFVANIPAAQFYHINHDMDIPYNVGGGMQDNGTWVGPSQAWKSGGITNHDWQEVFFGDGFDLSFRPDDNRYVYAMSQGGNVGMVDRETGATYFVKPLHPDGATLRFNWNAAFAQDPREDCTIYFGSQFLHRSTDCGKNWTIISPDLTTNDPEKQKADISGGLTYDATQAENFTTILAIAPSYFDEDVIWVGTDDGNLQLTRDGGSTWTNLANRLPGAKAGSWIPYIELSKTNAGEAFVVVNDYRRNDWRPMVFHTRDYGATFRRIVSEEQVDGYALSIVQDPEQPGLLFLGTDYGLYYSLDYGANWTKWTEGFPSVPVADMKIHPREHDLIIGTFGRAAWILDDIRPLREMARTEAAVLDEDFTTFPAPDAYLAERRSYQGIRFIADAEYVGEDRPYGALLTAWVKPPSEEADLAAEKEEPEASEETEGPARRRGGKGKGDKVKIQVINADGDTLRTFSQSVEPGFNRFTWNLREDGIRYPSRREPRPDADPPTGGPVMPGTYTLLMTYGDQTSSTEVTVHPDPRIDYPANAWAARRELEETYTEVVNAATAGFERLQDASETIQLVEKAMVNAPDSVQTDLKEMGKALRDSIAALEKLYMSPEDVKGILRNPDDLNSTLFTARRYISDVVGEPSQMARVSLEQAKAQTQEVLEKVNAFLENDFRSYREKVESMTFPLFKEMEPVRIGE